jgi:hydroxymethylglutaryl-CoA synthase
MSNGIVRYGAYVPRYRLQHTELGGALGVKGGKGARTIASYDEDATTMGVEAARRALGSDARGWVGSTSIHFATSTPPYLDKTNATAIHAALDLGHEGFAVDMAGSPRSAIGALKASAALGGLAVLSDLRTGRPTSADERGGADGAAAFLFGDEADAIATILGEASASAEFLDRWRIPGETASRSWEERFGQEMYMPLIKDAVTRALAAAGVEQPDHVIVSSPHTRSAVAAAKKHAGTIPSEEGALGYAGAADAGLKLAAVLDRAEPGQTILVISAADGCDALVLKTTAKLADGRADHPVLGQLPGGRDVAYATYLTWRGMLDREPPRRPEPDRPAGPPSARSEAWKFAFVGSRCENCSFVHVPPVRVCKSCHHIDEMERIALAKNEGTVATFTVDRLAFSPSPPMINVVVDFDGGGRYMVELADAAPDEVQIGTRVQMSFRRLYTVDGVHNYFWKAVPLGTAEGEG